MIQKIKKYMMVAMASFAMIAPGLAAPLLATGVASADIQSSLCDGANKAADKAGSCTGQGINGQAARGKITDLAKTIVDIISVVVGVTAIIFIIVAGFRYITSGGDSNKVGGAKNTLIYAIIGLIVVALAQIIVQFVVSSADSSVSGITG